MALYEIKEIKNDEDSYWDDFIGRVDGGSVFQTSSWLKLSERYQGGKLIRLAFIENGETKALFPFFIKRHIILKVLCSPYLLGPPLGPLVSSDIDLEKFFDSFERYVKKNHINFTRVMFPPGWREDFFLKRKFVCIKKPTHILSLSQGEKSIWTGMEGRCRTAIRKAEKSGVTVDITNDDSSLERYFQMAESLYKRQGQEVPNVKNFYKDLFTGVMQDKVSIVIAISEGKEIAGAVFLHYNKFVFYYDGVSDSEYNSYCPNNAIQWFMIRWAIKNSYLYYDFVRSDFPWIAKFKKSFGGDLHEYLLIEKTNPSFLFPLRQIYGEKIRPWLRMLSFKITKILKKHKFTC